MNLDSSMLGYKVSGEALLFYSMFYARRVISFDQMSGHASSLDNVPQTRVVETASMALRLMLI